MLQLFFNKPFLILTGLCLLLCFLAGMFTVSFPLIHYFLLMSILSLSNKQFISSITTFIISLLFVLGYLFAAEHPLILLIGEIFCVLFLWQQNKEQENIGSFTVIALSFFLHLYYIQYTSVDIRQHDFTGIIFYIWKITTNGLNLVSFNPWQMYYLFHQPLHFIMSGYLYNVELHLTNSIIIAQESMQYFSLFYVTATTVLVCGILKKLGFSGINLYIGLILFAFNPTLFLLSGYVASDAAILFWMMLFLYNLITWWQTEQTKSLVYAAICFGIGTLTKLSILPLVPAVCCLFLYKIYQTKNKSSVIQDICLFIIVAVPLSLSWILRNHILFDMDFYNIPDTSPGGQNFRYQSFLERISDFSNLFIPFINAPYDVERNMWLALIKTELFGEWKLSLFNYLVYIPALILYLLNIAMKTFIAFGALFVLVRFRKFDFLFVFLALIYFTVWIYSFKYAMDYPYVCSTDYRLFTSLLLPEIAILSVYAKKYSKISLLIALIYAALSSFIYVAIA